MLEEILYLCKRFLKMFHVSISKMTSSLGTGALFCVKMIRLLAKSFYCLFITSLLLNELFNMSFIL